MGSGEACGWWGGVTIPRFLALPPRKLSFIRQQVPLCRWHPRRPCLELFPTPPYPCPTDVQRSRSTLEPEDQDLIKLP